MAIYCYKCGLALRDEARFCHGCGTKSRNQLSESSPQNDAASSAINDDRTKASLVDRMRKRIKEARKDGTNKIDSYLVSLESRNGISGVKLTEGRREFLRKRLTALREKLAQGDEEIAQEEWETLSAALESLPEDLIDEKCIICFKPVSEGSERPLSFCPHCLRGGHQEHLAEWIKIKGTCPICRQTITISQLVRYQVSS